MFGLSMVPTIVAAGQLRFFCLKGSRERDFHIDQGMFLSGEHVKGDSRIAIYMNSFLTDFFKLVLICISSTLGVKWSQSKVWLGRNAGGDAWSMA